MTNTLCLILAAGEGKRAQAAGLLNENEPVKPMVVVDGKRLVDYAIKETRAVGQDIAVLSYPSEQFHSLDEHVSRQGVRVIKQKAKRRNLPNLLALPYILVTQYRFSSDARYLRSFDSILVMPSDQVYRGVDFADFVRFHDDHLNNPNDKQLTLLAKDSLLGGRTELFKMDGDRIVWKKKYRGKDEEGYVKSTQAGVYVFSKGLLQCPLAAIYSPILRYKTNGDWSNLDNRQISKG